MNNKVSVLRRALLSALAVSVTTLAGLSRAVHAKSASETLIIFYSNSGTTREVATLLAGRFAADLFEIRTVSDYNPSSARADRARGYLPEIRKERPDAAQYKRIIMMFPVWGYTVSLPVQKFLKTMDFAGRGVVAITTDIGRLGSVYEDFRGMIRNGVYAGPSLSLTHASYMKPQEILKKVSAWENELRKPAALPRDGFVYSDAIEAKGEPLKTLWIDTEWLSVLPRTATLGFNRKAETPARKSTDPAPGLVVCTEDGKLLYKGREVGRLVNAAERSRLKNNAPVFMSAATLP